MAKSVFKKSDKELTVILHEYITYRKKPRNLKTEDLPLFSHEFRKTISQAHILVLKDHWVVNELVLSLRHLNFFTAYTFPWKWETRIKSIALQIYFVAKFIRTVLLLLNKRERIPYAIWITDHKSKQYFHWLTDALPRLVVAQPYIKQHALILPDYYQKLSYVKESLEFFKIPVYFVNPTTKLHIGELILPGHTAQPGNYNRMPIKQLRDILRSHFKGANCNAYRKIYISREKSARRKICNERAVVHILLQHGFEIHHFEDYPLERQIQL